MKGSGKIVADILKNYCSGRMGYCYGNILEYHAHEEIQAMIFECRGMLQHNITISLMSPSKYSTPIFSHTCDWFAMLLVVTKSVNILVSLKWEILKYDDDPHNICKVSVNIAIHGRTVEYCLLNIHMPVSPKKR